MAQNPWQDHLLNNIFCVELYARLGMSLFFGLATFGFAWLLNAVQKESKGYQSIFYTARACFLVGMFCLLTHGVIDFILPMSAFVSQIYTFNSLIFASLVFMLPVSKKEFLTVSFIVSALIFLSMTVLSFLEPKILLQAEKSNFFINLHVALSILGESLFVVSFCASFLFIHNHYKLKKKILTSTPGGTSLSSFEKVAVWSSFLGLGFITLALISGLMLVFVGKESPKVDMVKIFWAFFVWGWYAVTILGRSLWGWRGKKGAWLIVMGCVFLVVGLLGNVYYYYVIK